MTYKARHVAEPKYAKYVRATGASIAAMAVLTAVPAVAIETDAPLGDVGETTPITQPTNTTAGADDTGDVDVADMLNSFATIADRIDAGSESARTDGTAGVNAPELPLLTPPGIDLGSVPGADFGNLFDPSAAVERDATVEQGSSITIDTAEIHPAGALAEFTFDNPHDAAGVHIAVNGTDIAVSADKNATPGVYTINGTASALGAAKQVTLNLTVTESNSGTDTEETPTTPTDTNPETSTNPSPGDQDGTPDLAWAAGTNVVQGATATAKFTGSHGGVKPNVYVTDAVYDANGVQVDSSVVAVDPASGTATIAPSWDLEPGTYTAFISGVYDGGSRVTGQPLTFTVTAGKFSDRYTPTVAPAYIGTNPERVAYSKVTFDNAAAPFGTTYTVKDTNNVVEVDSTDGTVVFTPNPELKPDEYTAQITVHYPVANGAKPDTDTVTVRYSVGDTFQALNYTLVTDKTTVTRRDTATIGVPYDANGKELPSVLHIDKGRDWPEWVTLNKDGTLTAAPDLNVKPGTYQFTSLATFPDESTGEVKNTIVVPAGYKTQGFKYKRKDGLGAKVGRAIDKALGTEKPGSAGAAQAGTPGDTTTNAAGAPAATDNTGSGTTDGTETVAEGDTETAATTTATPTDNMVAAPAEVAANEPSTTGTRGAAALQTTGADDTGLYGAGAAAGGFALAAAAAFALRRREQDGTL